MLGVIYFDWYLKAVASHVCVCVSSYCVHMTVVCARKANSPSAASEQAD